jgi:hypothetical protein
MSSDQSVIDVRSRIRQKTAGTHSGWFVTNVYEHMWLTLTVRMASTRFGDIFKVCHAHFVAETIRKIALLPDCFHDTAVSMTANGITN